MNPRYNPPGEVIGDELTIIGRALQAYLHTEADSIVRQHAMLDESMALRAEEKPFTDKELENIRRSKQRHIAWLMRAGELRDKYIIEPAFSAADHLQHARESFERCHTATEKGTFGLHVTLSAAMTEERHAEFMHSVHECIEQLACDFAASNADDRYEVTITEDS